MQVSVEKKEGVYCLLNIELPAVEIDHEVLKRIQRIAKTAKVDGFRPGKVPVRMIKHKYGEQVRAEVLGDVLPRKYSKAIQEQNLHAAGVEIEIINDKEGEELRFNVNVELFPEVVIKDLDKIVVEKPVVELGDKQIEKMISNLRKQFATWKEVERAVKDDDCVTIDFSGMVDGEVFKGGTANSSEVVIGSGKMIPGFEDGIIGMKKYEEKIIDVTFPEDYQNHELKGKRAEFNIIVKNIKEADLPEIDNKFIEQLGMKGGFNEFHTEIKQHMVRALKNSISGVVKTQVFDQLVDIIDFHVPTAFVQREISRSKDDVIKHAHGAKSNMKAEDLPDDLFKQKSKKSVKLGLILQAIIRDQNFEADQESIDTVIEEMALVYEDAQEVRDHIINNKQELDNIKNAVVESKIVEWVVKQGRITEKPEDCFNLIKKVLPQGGIF